MINEKHFVETYEKYYFKDYYKTGKPLSGLGINRATERAVETYIVENKLKKGVIDKYVVAWKAGRLQSKKAEDEVVENDNDLDINPFEKDDCYLNGRGGKINKSDLDYYLKTVKGYDSDNFKEAFEQMRLGAPKNFGSVYIINLLYFGSKEKFPIYDNFAHKAVKALFMGKSPADVFVGALPSKDKVKNVVNVYEEYLWLVNKVFGTSQIDRHLDRALWVYGHSKETFNNVL